MPVIRITDTAWDRLKRWAVPLEDSPDDALRKVLEAAEEHLKCGGSTGSVDTTAGNNTSGQKRSVYGHYEFNGIRITIADLWRKMGATVEKEIYVSAAGIKMEPSVATFNGVKYAYAASSYKGKALSKHDGKPSPLLPWIASNPNIRQNSGHRGYEILRFSVHLSPGHGEPDYIGRSGEVGSEPI